MTNGSELKSPSAKALRAAGYIPLPRWWVTREQMDLIAYLIRDNVGEVNHIRRMAAKQREDDAKRRLEGRTPDPQQRDGTG